MRFAEIVRTRATSDETIATVCELATACGKNPVVVNDIDTKWGFVANRIYVAAIEEASASSTKVSRRPTRSTSS